MYRNIDFSPFHGHLKWVHTFTMSMIVGLQSIRVDLTVINLFIKKFGSLFIFNIV